VRTYDMMRIPGGAKAISQGAASTVQMTDAVLAKLAQQGPEEMRQTAEFAGASNRK
jgi:hypothetical protein